MEYQRLSSGTPYSRKLMSNGPGGLSGKHVYDGVFAGAAVKPAGTGRVEDYREIFGGSGANTCSIPILEVPELDEGGKNGKAYIAGGGTQSIDYSKIFGGLGDADFGVAHEELFAKPKKRNDSFKQTRSPTQGRSQFAGSERFNVPKEQKVLSPETSFESFDGVKQFNVSYNKINPGSKNGTNGTTHIAQYHAAPGYTILVDETPPSKMTEGGNTVHSVLNDAHLNVNVREGLKEGKAHRKAVSGPQPSVAATESFRSPAELQKKSSRTRSISNDLSFDAFEIGLGRNPPSSSLANFSDNNWGSNISMNSKFRVSRSESGGVSGNYSPAFSDEEVDANSDAAASAAALRKAIEEAQMKIKVAKGLMERKKGLQNHKKMSFNNGVKSQKRELKTAERVNVSKEQEIQEKCETKDTPKQDFTSLSEEQIATKGTALTSDLKDEKLSPITIIAVEETHCLESKSRSTLKQAFTSLSEKNATKAAVLTTDLKDEKQSPTDNNAVEETQCSESKSSPMRAFTRLSEQNATKATILTPDLKDEKQSLITNNAVDEKLCFESISTQMHNRLEEAEDWESTEEFFEALESEEHSEVALELDQVDSAKQMVPSDHENERRRTAEEKIKRPEESIEEPKAFEEPFNGEKIEREVNSAVGVFQWNVYANFIKPAQELYLEENDEKIGVACKQEEADGTAEVSYEWEECETKLEKLDQREENAGLPIEDWVETEKIHRKALTLKEKKNRSDEVPLVEENDGGRSEIHEKEENVEGNGEDLDRIECERKLQGWNLEEYDENHNFHRTEDAEMSCEVHKEEIIKVRFNDLQLQEKDEADERLREGRGVEGHGKVEESKENERILEETDQINGAKKSREQMHEGIENEMIRSEIHHGAQDEKNMEATEHASRYDGKNLQPANDATKPEENENQDGNDKAWGHKTNFGAVHLTAEVLAVRENERIIEATEVSPLPEETEKGSKAAEEANNLDDEEAFETAGLSQGFIIVDANKKHTVDITEAPVIGKNGTYLSETDVDKKSELQETDYNSLSNQENCSEATRERIENGDDSMQSEHQETDYNSMSNQENCTEEVTIEPVENDDDMYGSEVDTRVKEIESSSVSSHNESLPGDNAESLSDPEKGWEFGGNGMDIKQSEVASNLGEHENFCESSHKERCVDNSVDIETSQETCMFEGQGKTMEISEEEELSQSTDEKENQRNNLASEERKAEHALQKDEEAEKEHLRKTEEEKEWEMEKGKERIAVERAIREARERAFAEARERAEKAAVERAAAEAKQRLMTETRERLEKASIRVSTKLAAEKTSIEAKLKAERAAVERATAEARQRALEKALSEKAALKARNEVEKSAAGPSSGSRHPGSSKHEKFNGANVESAQSSKATLERHQRTAERAAKALAEKNMRDLLAQKEQAERNRLAETLDIDVKRWSSGKEKNLRALLSTLQYILGPDSGWQPITLTDLISSTAVKKAYRKATLVVHPDKLQQRGASIQQKYTCEKVFDLLQEAWNKFSAEER